MPQAPRDVPEVDPDTRGQEKPYKHEHGRKYWHYFCCMGKPGSVARPVNSSVWNGCLSWKAWEKELVRSWKGWIGDRKVKGQPLKAKEHSGACGGVYLRAPNVRIPDR